MKKTLPISNIQFFALGFVALCAFVGVRAENLTAPTATAPASGVDAPLHTGPDQSKDGSLSVGTFAAWQDAAFYQQAAFAGTVFGGHRGDAASTVRVGDTNSPTNLSADGGMAVFGTITNGSVAAQGNGRLCATANGTIVRCVVGTGATTTTPVNQAPATAPIGATAISIQQSNNSAQGLYGFKIIASGNTVTVPINVYVHVSYNPGASAATNTLLQKLARYFTAEAKVDTGVPVPQCTEPTDGEDVHLVIPANTNVSSASWYQPGTCQAATLIAKMSYFTPLSDGGTTIQGDLSGIYVIQ